MKVKLFLAGMIIAGWTSPALALNYYVVQNTKTLKCSILPKKPKGKTVVIVSGTTVYKTRKDAHAALRAAAPCKA